MSLRFDKSKDNQIRENGLIMSVDEVVDYMNASSDAISSLHYENVKLKKKVDEQQATISALKEDNEQLKNYFKKRAECSNFQINKLKEEIAELQEDNVDTIVELSKENEKLRQELKEIKENPINYF